MRLISLALMSTLVAGCTMMPPPAGPDLRGQSRLAEMLAGKVAGPPQRCLQSDRADDMIPIDATTIAYRDGRTTWVNHVQGSCAGLAMGNTLVTKPFGFSGPCAGDIAHVVEPASGMMTGSCTFGEFVPYRRP